MVQNIKINSDDNELQFQQTVFVNKLPFLEYKYTKSITKLGMTVLYSQEQLDKMIKQNIFQPC